MGMFDFLNQPKDDSWKDEQMAAQKAILDSRKATGGFISDEEEEAIRQRRQSVGQEASVLKEIQAAEGADNLEAWKAARDEGKIKTATSGLERDEGSSRMGSDGLFAERVDERLPYIDRGYVDEGSDLMGKINSLFKAPAPKAPDFETDEEDPTAVSYGRKVNTSEEELQELISDLTFGLFGKKSSK